jgi:hypothetical protein
MPNNINISSGSKSFQNKIFGSIVKLTKPSFAYEGKIFSDSIFDNQRTIPLLENNSYFQNHGLIDFDVLINYNIYSNFDNILLQSINEFQVLAAGNTLNPIALKNIQASITNSISSSTTLGGNPFVDPYSNNPPNCPTIP